MGMPWLERLRQSSVRAAEQRRAAARTWRLSGQVYSCIDGRCSVPALVSVPYAQHRILGGAVTADNQSAILEAVQRGARLVQACNDVSRATGDGRDDAVLPVVCCTHTDCAYLAAKGQSEAATWERFRTLPFPPSAVPVGLALDVASGHLTVIGPEGRLSAADFLPSVRAEDAREKFALFGNRMDAIGFNHDDVVADLFHCLTGGAWRIGVDFCAEHQEEGIVIGAGVPGAYTHFSISPQFGDLQEPLSVALSILRQRGVSPFVAVSVCNERSMREDSNDLHRLQQLVVAALYALDCEVPVRRILVVRSTGNLCLVQ